MKELNLSIFPLRRTNEAGMKNRQYVKFCLFLINGATNLILINVLLPAPPPSHFSHSCHIFQFFLRESGRCTTSPKEIIHKAPPTLTADYKNKSSWSFYSHKYLSMQTIDWGRFSDWNPTEPQCVPSQWVHSAASKSCYTVELQASPSLRVETCVSQVATKCLLLRRDKCCRAC